MALDHRPMNEMTDREIMEEILEGLRTFADIIDAASSNPMLSMLIPNPIQQ